MGFAVDLLSCFSKERTDFAAEFETLDDAIRANRFADSRKSPDSRDSFQGFELNPCKFKTHFPTVSKKLQL